MTPSVSDTTTVADSMTAREMSLAAAQMVRAIGPKADVYLSVNADRVDDKVAYLSIHADGICGKPGNHKSFFGSGWPEVFAAAEAWLAACGPVQRNATIRKMALAIIELTDEHGKCTETMLRGRDFTKGEIAEFRDAACVRAGEMAGNAPFEVVT